MRSRITIIGFVLLQFSHFYCRAQVSDITFNLVEGINGRPLGKITDITQDKYGYMWFTGQGEKCLYRYDGTRLISFVNDKLDSNSFGGLSSETIYADDDGTIWIGLSDDGLDHLNPATGKFTHYKHRENNSKSISSNYVGAILRDRQGRLWIGTNDGLNRFDPKTEEFIRYSSDPNNPKTISSNVILNIYEDRQGVIWFATGNPFAAERQDGGLNKLNDDGTFTRYIHDPNNPHSLISNKVRAILEDSRGIFWIGTADDGLHTMDRETGSFERHRYDPRKPDQLSRPPLKPDEWRRTNDHITSILEDDAGSIWIGTLCAGINSYNPATRQITHYEGSNGFPDSTTWNGFKSREGVLWFSTQEDNLFRIDPFKKTLRRLPATDLAHHFFERKEMLEDSQGYLWVATRGAGLLQYDPSQKLVHRFSHDPKDPFSIPNDSVVSLFQNQRDSIWVGTLKGLAIFDKRTHQFSKLDFGMVSNSLNKLNIMDIEVDKYGAMWFSTFDGLVQYDRRKHSIKRYRRNTNDSASLSSNLVLRILENKSGQLWFSTIQGGINRFDRETDGFKHYLEGAIVIYVYEDSGGTLWAGTSNGLYSYDKNIDTFSPFFDGNVSVSSERTYGMIEDDQRNLWLSSPSAIVKISPNRDQVFIYGIKYGIIANSGAPASIAKASKGQILVGFDDGVYAFFPEELTGTRPLALNTTEFQINNVPVLTTEDGPLVSAIEETNKIELDYNQNNFAFYFAADDYRDPGTIKYASMLENYDNSWRDAGDEKTSRFFYVAPGNYVFRVKATAIEGAQAERSIKIHINPPWWKTWWAYVGYSLLAAGLLVIARRNIVQRERMRSEMKLERMAHEKAKEVDKLKSGFFANISHEFRTPLTLIQGPVQSLLEEFAGNSSVEQRLKMVERNSDLLLKLINQLLDLAKLEAGNMKVEASEIDFNNFINILVSSFSSFAVQKHVQLAIDLPPVGHRISIDKNKLEAILINLVNNAIKFTPAEGRVNVAAEFEQSDHITSKAMLVLRISDTGIGIPEELQARVFERFFQVSDAHKEVGTGIGLSLVKELAELMGGNITIKSMPGEGSEFKVSLPVILLGASETEATASFESDDQKHLLHESGNGTQLVKPQILVVEDNADLRSFIISCLGQEYDFLEAPDGKAGLETATKEIPDLIISDVMMPEMDGITMTGKIKKDIRSSHIPIIILTAKTSEDSKLSGLETGADDYLTKPFNKNELLLKVRNRVAQQQKIRDRIKIELLKEAPKVEVQSADEQFLLKVKDCIQSRLSDEQLSVESLADEIGLSRSQLFRKIVALTGVSVNELIRSFRLQKAAQLLRQNWGPVSQVAYEVGFSNLSYFSKIFKEEFGVLPSEFGVEEKTT